MSGAPRDPLGRKLAVLASPTPLPALPHVIPVCLRAVGAAARAGWDTSTCALDGLNELAAAEAARQGGVVVVATASVPPADHWSRLLRIVYGAGVRCVVAAPQLPLACEALIRLRGEDVPATARPVLATAHAVLERATAALLLPPLSGPDLLVEHADWLCRLFGIPVFNVATIGGLVSLYEAIEAIGP